MDNEYRKDFPILESKINGNNLVYFDNAATTQKPKIVIDALNDYYNKDNANPHRGAHYLSVAATRDYEDTREKIKTFINASSSKEIVFTKNATESLNLIAYSYAEKFIEEDDEIVLSISEHHSNIVPWQRIARIKKAKLKYVYVNEDGRLSLEDIKNTITSKTKIVSIAHMSNVLGTIHPIKEIGKIAHENGAILVVDGAQSIPHMKIDVQDLGADFFVFSGHKMLAPMGIGILYGKEALLEKANPFLMGGDMIEYVSEQETSFAELPFKFEAGTQNVEGAIGLSAAIDYINEIGYEKIHNIEAELTEYALEKLLAIPYVNVIGPKDMESRGGVISFTYKDVHPHDLASIVDTYGVALRSGHHCAQPLMKYYKIAASARISFYFYNTKEEVDQFIYALSKVREVLHLGA